MNRTDYQAAKAACENLAAVPREITSAYMIEGDREHEPTVVEFVKLAESHFPRTLAMLHKAIELLGPAVMANGYDTRERDALLKEWNTAPDEAPKPTMPELVAKGHVVLDNMQRSEYTKSKARKSVKKPKTRRGK